MTFFRVDPVRWSRRAVVATVAVVLVGALMLSIADGWRPGGGRGVPWIEFFHRRALQVALKRCSESSACPTRRR